MSSKRTKKLQAECERLSDLQRKATGAKYLELDKKWSRVAVILNKSRLRDFINSHASNKACSGRVESSGSPELFPAEVSPSAKVTRQTTRR